ncbi:MAG: MotA/TolQ/ExbB proton channel family protein [Verrucomicrobia bacterium]|nr:MotA/TolQ/ExbB proton channel family protein [Verrucomicrobiota bacterium]MBU1910751.1 MotA/TolQ/ExbB proton channel family protein [Verrucomicrobiota bacterium]
MNLMKLYASIGAAGIALVLVAAAAVYLCVKYVIYLLWIGHVFRGYVAGLERDPARLTGPAPANPLIRMFTGAVRHANRGANDLRAELAFLFHKHFRKVNRAMTLLRLISVISPLLGLMGTVLGIVKVFRVIGAQTAVNPALLATGIWEALITTIMGLTITIPALCFYYFFKMQINGFQVELMEYAGHFGQLDPKNGSGS